MVIKTFLTCFMQNFLNHATKVVILLECPKAAEAPLS